MGNDDPLDFLKDYGLPKNRFSVPFTSEMSDKSYLHKVEPYKDLLGDLIEQINRKEPYPAPLPNKEWMEHLGGEAPMENRRFNAILGTQDAYSVDAESSINRHPDTIKLLLKKSAGLNANPYLQAISSAMQAYEYARPQEADQPSALEQSYQDNRNYGLPSPRIERKSQPKLGLQEGFNY